MPVEIRYKVKLTSIRDMNIHWRKKRMLIEGIRIAKSHVLCPHCKVKRMTSKEIFKCCRTYKTAEHLATVTDTTQYDFNGSTRRPGVTPMIEEYLPQFHARTKYITITPI